MSRGKVFVVQEPVRRNKVTGDFEPVFDLTPAAVYGDIEILLPPGPVMLATAPMNDKLRYALRNFCDDDYILPTGSPPAMLAAGFYAAYHNRGRYKILQWDKRSRQYIVIPVDYNRKG